jgi:hypothetical protein
MAPVWNGPKDLVPLLPDRDVRAAHAPGEGAIRERALGRGRHSSTTCGLPATGRHPRQRLWIGPWAGTFTHSHLVQTMRRTARPPSSPDAFGHGRLAGSAPRPPLARILALLRPRRRPVFVPTPMRFAAARHDRWCLLLAGCATWGTRPRIGNTPTRFMVDRDPPCDPVTGQPRSRVRRSSRRSRFTVVGIGGIHWRPSFG